MTQHIVWRLSAALLAAEGEAARFQWPDALSFFGKFLLVMALIYGVLRLTGWIGKKFGKH